MSTTQLTGTLPVASPYPFPSGVQVAVGTSGGRRRRRTHRRGGADAPKEAEKVEVTVAGALLGEDEEVTAGRRRRRSHRRGGADEVKTTAGRRHRRRHTKKGGRRHKRHYKLF